MKFRFCGFCFLNLKVDFLGVVGIKHDVAHGKEVKDVWSLEIIDDPRNRN